MIFLKWLALALLDWLLLLTVPVAAPLIALFTREQPYNLRPYTWGWLWGTWDNPPQGDRGFVTGRCWFPGHVDGVKGYLNRVHWMLRNPLYGLARLASLPYNAAAKLSYVGDPNISDKERRPGWYFAQLTLDDKLIGFELYVVAPWGFGRCLRMRLGWKLMTDKFERYGFAQLVNTCNPFDGYGDSK